MSDVLDKNGITQWRSIITLVVFIITNSLIVLFPFHVPVYVPRQIFNLVLRTLSTLRVISPRASSRQNAGPGAPRGYFVRLNFPMGLTTAPLEGVLLLLTTTAIGRKEVKDGTIGANNIVPLDIVAFALTMGFVINSIDASGLVRHLSFIILKRYGRNGRQLFFSMYAMSFLIGCLFGNDAVIQIGVMFLSYMTRMSTNIIHPRAWIHTNFAIANVASTIFVSSSTTNVVIAQAFRIGFAEYTANIIVPVFIAVVILLPFLLYVVFADSTLIPTSIKTHTMPEDRKMKKPINPNIDLPSSEEEAGNTTLDVEGGRVLTVEEIMNPFLDKAGAVFGVVIMIASLVVLLALTAADLNNVPVFWVTMPAAFVVFCWGAAEGWFHRHYTREIARRGLMEARRRREERAALEKIEMDRAPKNEAADLGCLNQQERVTLELRWDNHILQVSGFPGALAGDQGRTTKNNESGQIHDDSIEVEQQAQQRKDHEKKALNAHKEIRRPTLVSWMADLWRWIRETFPTTSVLVERIPFSVVPFAIPTFILVQALASTGWVAVLAKGWDSWVYKTGTVGAIGGMGFLSVILSNIAGTNIGTAVLLSRVLQNWAEMHVEKGTAITERTYWGAVYAMAIGTNYAAFSLSFGASLAGIGWRRDLKEKRIRVRQLEFARVNLPLIAITMAVSSAVLIGEVYIFRQEIPYAARA